MMKTKALDAQYIAHTYARFPIEIVGGHGAVVVDDEGKEYIDLGTGIAVNVFGMCDEAWIAAVEAQLHKFQHTSNLYYSAPCAQLAQMLCERTGLKRVFFGNSGAEANECAIKAARKYAMEKKGPEYSTILTLENSFHGRTLTTLAATGQAHYHELYQPLTPGFVHARANDLDSVKALREFQRTNGLPETGEADEKTRSVLYSDSAISRRYPYRVEVSLDGQTVAVYALNANGTYDVARSFHCSTGLNNTTPRGIFLDGFPANRWHYFEKFECWAQYSYEIEGNIMFHSVIFSTNDEKSLRENSLYGLGSKASHGCIRLKVSDARWLYENCKRGTLVIVIY